MKENHEKNIFPKNKPWRETPLSGELKMGGGSCSVIICPDKNPAGKLKDIDVIHLILENARGEKREFVATPDEALEVAGMLSNAVMFWLNFKSRDYMKKFNVRRNNLTKNFRAEKTK